MTSSRRVHEHPKGGFELWSWSSYSSVQRGEWHWPNFSPEEMRCRASGRLTISPVFMDKSQKVRTLTGIRFPVTSGYRSPTHNQAESHTKSLEGPHPDAQAMDGACSRSEAYEIQKAAMAEGFVGIGIKQHGDSRYLHLDCWYRRPRGTLWTYYEP